MQKLKTLGQPCKFQQEKERYIVQAIVPAMLKGVHAFTLFDTLPSLATKSLTG